MEAAYSRIAILKSCPECALCGACGYTNISSHGTGSERVCSCLGQTFGIRVCRRAVASHTSNFGLVCVIYYPVEVIAANLASIAYKSSISMNPTMKTFERFVCLPGHLR